MKAILKVFVPMLALVTVVALGPGQLEGKETKCSTCSGTGQVLGTCAMCAGKGKSQTGNSCQSCGGSGQRYKFCGKCGGTGTVKSSSDEAKMINAQATMPAKPPTGGALKPGAGGKPGAGTKPGTDKPSNSTDTVKGTSPQNGGNQKPPPDDGGPATPPQGSTDTPKNKDKKP